MHLSDKAVDPPGEARPDLDIFLDYARRMDFRDKDGQPLPQWHDAESAFEAWAGVQPPAGPATTAASATTKLRGAKRHPMAVHRRIPRRHRAALRRRQLLGRPDYCETYGRDLVTGAPVEATEYRALNPHGRAVIKAAEYLPAARAARRGATRSS